MPKVSTAFRMASMNSRMSVAVQDAGVVGHASRRQEVDLLQQDFQRVH
jgi:hypothetical protein